VADEIDRLYELPLGEFTSARNALAKELRDPDVQKLKKPSIAAWAVNQLARRREVDMRRLIRAGEKLESSQREAVGGGDAKAFERARRDERDAVRKLRTEAAELLRADGHPASDANLERVAKTLHAGAATEDGRVALRDGRLTDEIEPQGFEAFEGLTLAPRPARGRKAPARDNEKMRTSREEAAEARRAADEAQARAKEAESAAARARREADRATDRAERLEARARELE
jgi:hypothetical protein